MVLKHQSNKAIFALSAISFLLSLQLGFTAYIDSSYLSRALSIFSTTPDNLVGYVYMAVAIFSLFLFSTAPQILRRFGNFKLTFFASLVLPSGLFLLSTNPTLLPVLFSYALVSIAATVIYTSLDIFLGAYIPKKHTALVRSLYFALGSLGFMLSPSASGYLTKSFGLEFAYLAGAFVTIPISLILFYVFRNFHDSTYEDISTFPNKTLRKKVPGLLPVFIVQFALQSFYAFMTIYAPLYFIESIGLRYDEFGLIITIALSTFVILPTLLGYIADTFIGEKEFITLGLFLMGTATIAIPIFAHQVHPLMIWGAILLVSRIGATMTESMTDAYFFKTIEPHHPSFITFYRRARPFAQLLVPGICALSLSMHITTLPSIFIVIGVLMIITIIPAYQIIDTQ